MGLFQSQDPRLEKATPPTRVQTPCEQSSSASKPKAPKTALRQSAEGAEHRSASSAEGAQYDSQGQPLSEAKRVAPG
jgi:hypothetical protein